MDERDKPIYTIGHSNLEETIFIGLLVERRIECLADIRSAPYSRFHPQFNRNRLEAAVRENGIEYAFLGNELGGRIPDPSCYAGGKFPERKTDYARSIEYDVVKTRPFFTEGIERLVGLAERRRTAIMCSEEDPANCHRNLVVGRRLEELGFTIVHIRSKKAGATPPSPKG